MSISRCFRYEINFTSDLSDALAEVNHLEKLGFPVPEVARNMSNQKSRLTQLADDLGAMVDNYHKCLRSLEKVRGQIVFNWCTVPACFSSQEEVSLMSGEIEIVTKALSAGHKRLTWNNLAIKESCLSVGGRSLSIFNNKIQLVHIIRADLTAAVKEIAEGKLIM